MVSWGFESLTFRHSLSMEEKAPDSVQIRNHATYLERGIRNSKHNWYCSRLLICWTGYLSCRFESGLFRHTQPTEDIVLCGFLCWRMWCICESKAIL